MAGKIIADQIRTLDRRFSGYSLTVVNGSAKGVGKF
jgi:hypothetical protein